MATCPYCKAPAIEIRWPNGGSWACGSTAYQQDASARQSWACKRFAEQRDLIRRLAETLAIEPTLDHSCDLEGYDANCRECVYLRQRRSAIKSVTDLTGH